MVRIALKTSGWSKRWEVVGLMLAGGLLSEIVSSGNISDCESSLNSIDKAVRSNYRGILIIIN